MEEKTFIYEENGLKYTVTLTQEGNGPVMATIVVNEGQMDVNAVYWGDDEHTGPSANLGGPLNMNGGGSTFDGERVQWDEGLALSQPGLGRAGTNTNKETFLTEGEELGPFVLSNNANLDDIDFLGIRATSTSTPEGSIKGVSVPEEPEDPGDPGDSECVFKVFFAMPLEEGSANGEMVFKSDLDPSIVNPTLQDYFDVMLARLESYGEIQNAELLARIDIYRIDENGNIGSPEQIAVTDGFEDLPLPCLPVEEHCAPEDDVVQCAEMDFA